MRLACWDSKSLPLISRGFSRASRTALAVISLNWMRPMFGLVSLSSSAMCQAMASPSRSGSGARKIVRALDATLVSWSTTFCFPGMTPYWGSKPLASSTPSFFWGRSRTWPTEAST